MSGVLRIDGHGIGEWLMVREAAPYISDLVAIVKPTMLCVRCCLMSDVLRIDGHDRRAANGAHRGHFASVA